MELANIYTGSQKSPLRRTVPQVRILNDDKMLNGLHSALWARENEKHSINLGTQ